MTPPRRRWARWLLVCAVSALLVALASAWILGPLGRVLDPATLARGATRLRDWPLAPLAVIACFIAANAVAMPSTLMIATTVLVFGALRGALYADIGLLVSGSTVYLVCRHVARDTVDRWLAARADPRIAAFHDRVARRGLIAVVLLRLTPIPFTIQNIVLGASRIGYVDFLLGTMLGILPVTVVVAGLAAPFEAWLAAPDTTHLAVLAGVVGGVVVIGWLIRRWTGRRT